MAGALTGRVFFLFKLLPAVKFGMITEQCVASKLTAYLPHLNIFRQLMPLH
jgi:hypothetical protein